MLTGARKASFEGTDKAFRTPQNEKAVFLWHRFAWRMQQLRETWTRIFEKFPMFGNEVLNGSVEWVSGSNGIAWILRKTHKSQPKFGLGRRLLETKETIDWVLKETTKLWSRYNLLGKRKWNRSCTSSVESNRKTNRICASSYWMFGPFTGFGKWQPL